MVFHILIILALSSNIPMNQKILEPEHHKWGKRQDRNNDKEVDIIWCNDCIPIFIEIVEDWYCCSVDEIDEREIWNNFEAEDVTINQKRHKGWVEIVGEEY